MNATINIERRGIIFENLFGSKARSKIIKILAIDGELNISQIISRSGVNHSSAEIHLEYLERSNLVEEKVFGKIRIFRFKEENIKARSIQNLIKIIEE